MSPQPPVTEGRIVLSSVLGGIAVTLASMFFLMSFAAALGIWSFRLDEIAALTNSFWIYSAVAWTASASLGAYICVLTMNSPRPGTCLLNAFVMWAASYLVFGGMTLTIAQTMAQNILLQPTQFLIGTGFVGDASAVIGALLFGRLALWVRSPEASKRRLFFASSTSERGWRIPVNPGGLSPRH